jgi:folate-binding Fe-S cluster repair protein YgfZ
MVWSSRAFSIELVHAARILLNGGRRTEATMSTLLRTPGVVRLANRRLLQLQGVDASRFLQAILTNDMKSVAKPGDALYGGFLTTKGRLLGDCSVVQTQVSDALIVECALSSI